MIATPAERHAYLAPVVSCEGWIGKCVVIVPDRELVDPIIVIGRVDLEENSRNGNLRTLARGHPKRGNGLSLVNWWVARRASLLCRRAFWGV
jgi:hypothetical protein